MATAVSTSNLDKAINSETGGMILLSVGSTGDVQYDSSQPCRSCYVKCIQTAPVYMNIDTEANGTTGWKMTKDAAVEVPVDDVQKIHFRASTGTRTVQILWRN